MQKFGTINNRMHQKVFALRHMHTVPAKNFVNRKAASVLHDFLAGCSLLLIDKVADQHIQCLRSACQLCQGTKDLHIRFFIYPVITVYNLKVKTCRITDSGIDSFSMSTIFLMDSFDDRRIFFRICICNLCCTVRRPIINHKDFNLFPTF